ncbi:MAG TPA: hypothetical protein ENN81_08155 [Phycisphaerales bacterium]|nr:hypothetical protein [Phycisphaerales bacterium]
MTEHTLTGFGFGPIQGGLFVKEAFDSGRFGRMVIAEIDAALVQAVREAGGSYHVNIAGSDGIETVRIDAVELLNPREPDERRRLVEALEQSTEIVTSLPSVSFYEAGGHDSVSALITDAVAADSAPATVIYTAENNNHAAEILSASLRRRMHGSFGRAVQCLNTVIGKMSRVVTDAAEIERLGLTPIAPGLDRAFLVEAFNRILVTRTRIDGFAPGIDVFAEKDDLLPFEEAKLYGHNAIHALLAYLGALKGYEGMTDLKDDASLMGVARDAFLKESGGALVKKYASLGDELFTESGYRDYAADLLDRMTNPWLADTVARAGRDVVRKLGPSDRIFGTMQLALEYGVEPRNMALGALAAVARVLSEAEACGLPKDLRAGDWRTLKRPQLAAILRHIWSPNMPPEGERLIDLTFQAIGPLARRVG